MPRFVALKQGISPLQVFDNLHHPAERSLARFSDSLGPEVSRMASATETELDKKMWGLQVFAGDTLESSGPREAEEWAGVLSGGVM